MSSITVYINQSGPIVNSSEQFTSAQKLVAEWEKKDRRVCTPDDVLQVAPRDRTSGHVNEMKVNKVESLSRKAILTWLGKQPKPKLSPPQLLKEMKEFPPHKRLHPSFDPYIAELAQGARAKTIPKRKMPAKAKEGEAKKRRTSSPITSTEPPVPPAPLDVLQPSLLPEITISNPIPTIERSAPLTADLSARGEVDIGYELGKGILYNFIAFPHRTPAPPNPLPPLLKRLPTAAKIAYTFQTPNFAPLARGFWFIPITTPPSLSSSSVIRKQASSATWHPNPPFKELKTVQWNLARLKAFWKACRDLASKGVLGFIVAECVFNSSLEGEGEGDHIRVWCDANIALSLRGLMDAFNVRGEEGWFVGTRLVWFDETGRAVCTA